MKNLSVQAQEIEICEWTKTGGYIVLQPMEGDEIIIHRGLFEAWVDRNFKREWGSLDGETGTQSWDEYYQGDFIELDFIAYLTTGDTLQQVLKIIYATL